MYWTVIIKLKVQTLTIKDCKRPQTNVPKNAGSIKTWSAKIIMKTYQILQLEYCNAGRTTWKLTLQDMSCRVNFHVVRPALQYSNCRIWYVFIIILADQVFIDPAFFGTFVCGLLQSFMVNVCTLSFIITVQYTGYGFGLNVLNRVSEIGILS